MTVPWSSMMSSVAWGVVALAAVVIWSFGTRRRISSAKLGALAVLIAIAIPALEGGFRNGPAKAEALSAFEKWVATDEYPPRLDGKLSAVFFPAQLLETDCTRCFPDVLLDRVDHVVTLTNGDDGGDPKYFEFSRSCPTGERCIEHKERGVFLIPLSNTVAEQLLGDSRTERRCESSNITIYKIILCKRQDFVGTRTKVVEYTMDLEHPKSDLFGRMYSGDMEYFVSSVNVDLMWKITEKK